MRLIEDDSGAAHLFIMFILSFFIISFIWIAISYPMSDVFSNYNKSLYQTGLASDASLGTMVIIGDVWQWFPIIVLILGIIGIIISALIIRRMPA